MRTLASNQTGHSKTVGEQSDQNPPYLISLRPRPETNNLSCDATVMVTSRDGFIQEGGENGLFVHRTRLLSRYRYMANGEVFKPVTLSPIRQSRWLGYYLQSPDKAGEFERKIPTAQTLELRVTRDLSGGGLREALELTNYSQTRCHFEFALELAADFADQDETHDAKRVQQGTISEECRRSGDNTWLLTFEYRAEHEYQVQDEAGTARFHRGLEVRIESAFELSYHDRTLRFDVSLDPLQKAEFNFEFRPLFIDQTGTGPFEPQPSGDRRELNEALDAATKITVPGVVLAASSAMATISRAASDLHALRLRALDREDGWVPAAGLPEYVAFFGRDVLVSAMESAMLGVQMLRGALGHLAQWQTARTNDWRDEQPGRMLHQAEIGPLALLNFTPFQRYYGSISTPALFPWALGRLWRWTADRAALTRLIEPALKGLLWVDKYCAGSERGFYSYSTQSAKGLKNQGWKDSGDAIVYEDGSQVDDPIAICECQGYVYASKIEAADILDQLGRNDEARQMRHQARELKERFNEKFWMPDLGFFAMGLDKDGRQIQSIASNPLHCISAGIIDDSLIQPTVERLFEGDLYSGWGVRTLSTRHPAYNPYSYQRGSVWPFEQGNLSLGLQRYGFYQQLQRLAGDQFEVAALFQYNRLPEVFGGQPRDSEHPFPAVYPQANWPQAWSAAAIFAHLEALLGLGPDAPAKRLTVDPHLPPWLTEVRLQDLRVGGAVIDITFRRRDDGQTEYAIESLHGTLEVASVPAADPRC